MSPLDAFEEWSRAPCGLLEEILEARAVARAKAAIDRATTAEQRRQIDGDPLVQKLHEIRYRQAAKALQMADDDNYSHVTADGTQGMRRGTFG